MKKLLRAAGALSLGAASLAVAHTTHAAEGGDKPWTISAALRGFYDDNIFTAPDDVPGRIVEESFGLEIAPSLGYSRTMDNTTFSIGYAFMGRWFENRDDDEWDFNHAVNFKFSHEFSPRVKLDIQDDFNVFQEPSITTGSGVNVRAEGDNVANYAQASLSVGITSRFSAVLGYRNNLYRYDQAFFEAVLDRIEHLPSVDFRFVWLPTTTVVVGYQYGIFDFDGVDIITLPDGSAFSSDFRDRTSHFIYGGFDHSFSSNLLGSVRAGAQVTEYDFGAIDTDTTPFVDGSLVYTYAPGSQASVGVRHSITSTDAIDALGAGNVLQSQETTLFYTRWSHAFTARFNGGILAQFQNSEFVGGGSNGNSETYWTVGVNASYLITPNVSLDAAYYHDRQDSDFAGGTLRDYTRNRVSLGVKASF